MNKSNNQTTDGRDVALKGHWLVVSVLAAGCSSPTVEALPKQGVEARGLVLLIHGSGDSPSDWADGLGAEIEAALDSPELWDVLSYNWADDAANKLRAAARGMRHGEAIGEILNHARDYEAVQVIAHSVGGHVSHGIAESWTGGVLQQTFLDPFGGRGLLRWTYGYRRFGENADFAETYFNSDDGVPSTDRAPIHTHGFDVTAARDSSFDGDAHWWPIDWYQASLGSGVGLDLALPFAGDVSWSKYPPGAESQLSP